MLGDVKLPLNFYSHAHDIEINYKLSLSDPRRCRNENNTRRNKVEIDKIREAQQWGQDGGLRWSRYVKKGVKMMPRKNTSLKKEVKGREIYLCSGRGMEQKRIQARKGGEKVLGRKLKRTRLQHGSIMLTPSCLKKGKQEVGFRCSNSLIVKHA